MINKYEKTAQASGALMFPQFGIESCPPDICTWALAKHVREVFNAPTKDVIMNIQKLMFVNTQLRSPAGTLRGSCSSLILF